MVSGELKRQLGLKDRAGVTRSNQPQVLADIQTSSNVGQVTILSKFEVDFLVLVQKLSQFKIFFGTFRNRGPEM